MHACEFLKPTLCELLWPLTLRIREICLAVPAALHLSVKANVLDTLSLRDHLITDFLLSTVIL